MRRIVKETCWFDDCSLMTNRAAHSMEVQSTAMSLLGGRSVSQMYRKLSLLLDCIEELATRVTEPRAQVCLRILEEDLDALMSECEDRLFGVEEFSKGELESFCLRFDTVVEEVRALFS